MLDDELEEELLVDFDEELDDESELEEEAAELVSRFTFGWSVYHWSSMSLKLKVWLTIPELFVFKSTC